MALKKSERLNGVNQKMADVVRLAATYLPFDLCVVEGLRTLSRQKQLYAQGRTAPGKIVTWTLNSKHLPQADGTGHAVDLCAQIGKSLDWNKADEVAKAMFRAAAELGVKIRWGADWNQNGKAREKGETDGPHFELA